MVSVGRSQGQPMPSPLDRNFSILLADPDPATRSSVTAALSAYGHQITTEGDGSRVMELIRSTPFDLAIVAIDLPGVDGMQFLSHCRENYALAGMPVVILAEAMADDVCDRAFALGASAFLAKPLSRPLLTHTVWQLLRNRARDQELKWLKTRLGIESERKLDLAVG